MIIKSGITTLVERIYSPEPEEASWLEGICEEAQRAFEGQLAVHAYTAQVTPEGRFTIGTFGGDEAANAGVVAAHEMAPDLEDLRRLYFSGPVVSVTGILATSKNAVSRELHQNHMAQRTAVDTLGAMGMNSDGRACALGFVHSRRRISAATRNSLARIAGHLAAGYRIRQTPEAPEALVSMTGDVVEARTAEAASHSADLRRAALAMDRAKRHDKQDPDAALSYWKAMVEGKWSLVERFESDGRRILVACRNEPKTRPLRALSMKERLVVSRIALGRSAKLVAYELGFTESKVSVLLQAALAKLGLPHRTALVELYATLVDDATGDRGGLKLF